ncbi:hypothetical protein [Cohnella thailandensis]|jgi:hypothetical protein|uniref:Uncharacterized protein n=1 Tax=Cohnella thailandensis TaxID=557557 RepID=A0A841T1Y8_9BACL|nr:hypothetical protein [Cohnella thailandensis]MBB6636398.1 hypothetical protein [Cohnella thailandensis]MBP1973631.1 hypothetical protein [Cohnella thailandensis]
MNKPAGKKTVKKKSSSADSQRPQMKVVTSDACAACKTPCHRGLDYLERMSKPGAVGNGVPCVLTLPPAARPSSAFAALAKG